MNTATRSLTHYILRRNMKIKVNYIESKQELQRFDNMFLTKEAVASVRSL